MARKITTTGSKKLATLMKEFNSHFPFLRLTVGSMTDGKFISCDINKTLSEIRTKKGKGDISFSGRKKISTIENEFKSEYGLEMQICYTLSDGLKCYTSQWENEMSLTQFNANREKEDCKKNEWQ
jgi:hypothetical protein